MRGPVRGWKHCFCPNCGLRWKETSRDCYSASDVGHLYGLCDVHDHSETYMCTPDNSLEVDSSGNLLHPQVIILEST